MCPVGCVTNIYIFLTFCRAFQNTPQYVESELQQLQHSVFRLSLVDEIESMISISNISVHNVPGQYCGQATQ